MGVIKTFSEFINESIWSDMQDRSSGDTIKKRTFAKNNSINFLEIFSINIDEIKQQILNIL